MGTVGYELIVIDHRKDKIQYLKKNQNAPRPSENPPVRGEKMSKRSGGIKACKLIQNLFMAF